MIIGIDYASVDGNTRVDHGALAKACTAAGSQLGFAIFRGAWGVASDSTAQRDWHQASSAGLTCGAYLFLRMPRYDFDAMPEDQVHVFANSVGTLTAKDLVPTIDVEDTGLTAEKELSWVRRAWDAMKSIYGVAPMVYVSNRVWHEDLDDLPAGEMATSPLWLAKPWPWLPRTVARLSSAPFVSGRYNPVVPKPWGIGNWWIHQYQGDALPVPGFPSTVDLSRFNVMCVGETGSRVSWVQDRMGGIQGGVFDAAMLSQVRAFQRTSGLVADGIIGPRTFAALSWSRPLGHDGPTARLAA